VDPNVAAVQSAINEVTGELTSTYLGVDALNGNLTTSWPICTVSFLVIVLDTNTSDCSKIQGLLGFAAWSQLNPHVIDKVQDLGYTPLPFGYKTYHRPSSWQASLQPELNTHTHHRLPHTAR
jgi:ABC-type phosphate transport system substrate-binding protein